jgi:hypothetical protein
MGSELKILSKDADGMMKSQVNALIEMDTERQMDVLWLERLVL